MDMKKLALKRQRRYNINEILDLLPIKCFSSHNASLSGSVFVYRLFENDHG